MIIRTVTGVGLDSEVIGNYFRNLVNAFFKMLPMREDGEPSLGAYMQSLQREILGCKGLIAELQYDSCFLSLTAILQNLIDAPDTRVQDVRSEVFKAISICNKLREKYSA